MKPEFRIVNVTKNRIRFTSVVAFGVLGLVTVPSHAAPVTISMASPSTASAVAAPKTNSLISLEFTRTPVADVLNMVSKQGGLSLIVGEDVTGVLPSIYLEDVTPDEAIRYISQAASLSWKKLNSKTYIITKAPKAAASSADSGAATSSSDGDAINAAASDTDLPREFRINQPVKSSTGAVTQEASNLSTIELRNIKPTMMAYWIDPKHQPVPLQLRMEQDSQDINAGFGDIKSESEKLAKALREQAADGETYTRVSRQFGNNNGGNNNGGNNGNSDGVDVTISPSAGGTVALPEGVDNIIAVDALNALLVRGTDEGIDRLREVIAQLDKPVQQVEIEAQFVSVQVSDIDRLGIRFDNNKLGRLDFSFNPGNIGTGTNTVAGGLGVSYAGKNLFVALEALRSQGKTRVVSAPRVTTFNNMFAFLTSGTNIRFLTTRLVDIQGPNGQVTTRTETVVNTLRVGTTLAVCPTINRDGTITIVMQPRVSVPTTAGTDNIPPDVDEQRINTAANIKDGDTLVIGGLRSKTIGNSSNSLPILSQIPIIGSLFRSKNKTVNDSELIILVTARVVRRIDDPVPGT